jgi:hypothetical protein
MGPGNGPGDTNDLRINGLDLLGRKRCQETRWAHLFCFLLASFCEVGFVRKVLKYAIRDFSHEILKSLKYTISHRDRGHPR